MPGILVFLQQRLGHRCDTCSLSVFDILFFPCDDLKALLTKPKTLKASKRRTNYFFLEGVVVRTHVLLNAASVIDCVLGALQIVI